MWDKCPYTWKLNYVDKAETFKGNIYTLFGSAIHETIQAYLVCYYERTIKEADELPLHDILIYRMKELYKESKERYGDEFEVDQKEMIEFTNDGFAIIDEFLKRKGSHFKKKDTELVGIEMNLNYKLPKNLRFVGFMDVVLHDKKTGRMKVIDIKSSTMGWNKYMKADKNKTNQLLLYKHFMAIQAFSPASGKPSVNKVMNRLQEFMDECYDDKGKIISHDYEKCEPHKKCRSCKDL
jgi:mevalonate kinase